MDGNNLQENLQIALLLSSHKTLKQTLKYLIKKFKLIVSKKKGAIKLEYEKLKEIDKEKANAYLIEEKQILNENFSKFRDLFEKNQNLNLYYSEIYRIFDLLVIHKIFDFKQDSMLDFFYQFFSKICKYFEYFYENKNIHNIIDEHEIDLELPELSRYLINLLFFY